MKSNEKKNELRKKFCRQRDGLPRYFRINAGKKITQKFLRLPELISAKKIALFWSAKSEPSTHEIFKRIIGQGKTAFLPRVLANKKLLRFHKVSKPKIELEPGPFRIFQPLGDLPVCNPGKIDLMIVPGIVFDSSGYRLGYGKGYYDKFLNENVIRFTVGLTFEKNFVTTLPHTSADVPVQCVITEKRVRRVRND